MRLGKAYMPERRGCGRELIEGALVYDLEAETKLEFRPDGVLCLIDVPLVGGGQHG